MNIAAVSWKFGHCSARIFKSMMYNYAWTLIILWKKKKIKDWLV